MPHLTRSITRSLAGVAAVVGLALVGPAGVANADEPPAEPEAPCAVQTTQVAKAEAALARVTAVFERKQAKVVKAKRHLEKARAGEKAAAKAAVKEAKADKTETAKAKKAQQMRLAKALERLAECEAAQEPVVS